MGTTCTLRRASDADVRQLVADPTQAGSFLYGPPPVVRRVQPRGVLGLILRLLPIRIEEVDPSAPLPAASDDVLDLEKSWHGLHFLFTGSAQETRLPSGFLISGGLDLESEDDDSAPRLLDADQVREIHTFLHSLSRDELTRRYDAERMTELEIYPDVIWMRDTGGDHSARDHLLDAFDELRAFHRNRAGTRGGCRRRRVLRACRQEIALRPRTVAAPDDRTGAGGRVRRDQVDPLRAPTDTADPCPPNRRSSRCRRAGLVTLVVVHGASPPPGVQT